MHFILYILLYFMLFSKTLEKQIEIQCPSHCKCDIFENLKRAKCVNRTLVVMESNLPPQTEILDLSYNQITHLNDHIFTEQSLLLLKLLNISHNKVSQIHMNAFEGLNHLKTLDLSYNAIQYLLANWFWSLESLQELYLRGNSFSKFNEENEDEPLFDSKSLKRLDLSKCGISYLGIDALIKLPNLEILDVSENFLIHFDTATITPLKHLQILKIKNNTFSCDGVMTNLTNYCVQKGIRLLSDNPCEITPLNSEKFERIINMAEAEDEKNSWIYDDEESPNKTIKIIHFCNKTETDKSLLREIVELSPLLSILIPFIYGITVGILIACSVQIFSKKKRNTNSSGEDSVEENTYVSFDQGDTHLRRQNSGHFKTYGRFGRAHSVEERETLPLREWSLFESTPVLNRKTVT